MREFAFILMFALAAGCSAPSQPAAGDGATSATAASETAATTTETAAAAPVTEEEKPMSYYEGKVAEIKTGKGTIVVRFFPDVAPNHVRNFIDLAEKGFYNGTKFHRIIEGFMIQGGDPNTKAGDPQTWGMGGSEKNVSAEFNDKPHKRGMLSMARSSDPNSASSQFFITVADARFLDKQYTLFGEVLKGMDVADAIVSAPKGPGDRPVDPVAIESITIRPAAEGEK